VSAVAHHFDAIVVSRKGAARQVSRRPGLLFAGAEEWVLMQLFHHSRCGADNTAVMPRAWDFWVLA